MAGVVERLARLELGAPLERLTQDTSRLIEAVGAILDPLKNATRHDEAIISKMSSRVRIMIIPTNEELMIARDTRDLVLI